MAFVRKKLTNEDFSARPQEVVEKEKETHQVLLGKKKN
jgi:hypothetical protein